MSAVASCVAGSMQLSGCALLLISPSPPGGRRAWCGSVW